MSSVPAAGVPPPPPTPPAEHVRPSAWWFLAAAGIAVTGIVAGIVVAVVGVMQMYERIDGFARAAVPGTFDIEIDEPGGYTVYTEHDGPIGRPRVPLVEVTDPSGEPVRLRPYVGTVTYTTDDRDGMALYSFEADRPGTYTVEASGESGSTVAIGRGFGDDLTRSFALAGALGLAGVVGGVVTAIVVGVRRSRARRSAWAPPPSPGAPPPGWGGPPPGWGGPPPGWGGPPPGWGGPPPGAAPSPPGWAGPPGGAPTSPG